jgi:hypothetical protein
MARFLHREDYICHRKTQNISHALRYFAVTAQGRVQKRKRSLGSSSVLVVIYSRQDREGAATAAAA